MLSSGCRMKLYYPLYSGWSFPSMPHFFLTPTEACSWALSRFKRDGLSNIWGNGIYPEFIKFVGVIVTDNKSFTECAKKDLFSSKKNNISLMAASSCNYLAWTTLYYHMSKLTSHSSPSYRITYSIQVWTINCLQTLPTGQVLQLCLIQSRKPAVKITTKYGSCK